jgi:hypothetical protein
VEMKLDDMKEILLANTDFLQLVKTIEADYKGVKNPTGPFGWDNPFLC